MIWYRIDDAYFRAPSSLLDSSADNSTKLIVSTHLAPAEDFKQKL